MRHKLVISCDQYWTWDHHESNTVGISNVNSITTYLFNRSGLENISYDIEVKHHHRVVCRMVEVFQWDA